MNLRWTHFDEDMNTTQVFHSKDEATEARCHEEKRKFDVSFAKRRLAKFNGCTSEAFVLHLEKCEAKIQSS